MRNATVVGPSGEYTVAETRFENMGATEDGGGWDLLYWDERRDLDEPSPLSRW